MRRVNHDTHYKSPEGWHTNYIESAFSRWRRMEIGTYHRMSKRRLHLYCDGSPLDSACTTLCAGLQRWGLVET